MRHRRSQGLFGGGLPLGTCLFERLKTSILKKMSSTAVGIVPVTEFFVCYVHCRLSLPTMADKRAFSCPLSLYPENSLPSR